MTDDLRWTIDSEDELQDCRVFRVARTNARSPKTGNTQTFFRLHAPDWVNIVPLTADREVVMVRQFRHGSDHVTLEIPGGMVDADESPAVAAARELREETGYGAGAVTSIGVLNPNPALWSNRCHSYVAHDVEPAGAIHNEGTEQTVVELVPLDEIPARMRSGEIDHALVIAAFHWLHIAKCGDR
jgi:8-oxo-dGTP pyrophosphatase MutT (NUDIX family)